MALRFLVVSSVTLCCALTLAAQAAAEPVDTGGAADSVISDLKAQGYNVVINWLNGYDTVPLAVCTVQDVDSPDATPPKPGAFTTVYVDVSCPNHPDE
ncbi:hypothetical protein A5724_25315 [Mycobacterium sp. ACS1612]|uniref:hypothetical protein n=1 Tax=Mycobacterium sp. ACS1612 TaxID=1834117 RepID=UPI0007FDD8AE|nr:hypothetical protein [Mycobacterium sp. ACS1612]OBF29427.1 hypothetical protein A5724_25315 [Mycobacterium sp. ACS1612]